MNSREETSNYRSDKKVSRLETISSIMVDEGGVVDLTSASLNEETPLLKDKRSQDQLLPQWKRVALHGMTGIGCCPKAPSYELEENLPCLFRPLRHFFVNRFPFLKWLRRYSLQWLLSDIIAGISVGIMVVPQALAYAKIAGLPLQVGVADRLPWLPVAIQLPWLFVTIARCHDY